MPKYVFECSACNTRFSRTLKMEEHPTHTCPSCQGQAPRLWDGQGFGFDFAEGSAPGNSGVSKQDHPTADQAVGRSSDERWGEIHARDEVKDKVGEMGETHALIRRHGHEEGQPYIEYEAGTPELIKGRKRIGKQIDQILESQNKKGQ
jgi:putative FmdB family regulatory protein